MAQTKFQALCKWLSKRDTFRWSQMQKAFGNKTSSLNSYTTYLNTLRRTGWVVQTSRGMYKVQDRKLIATLNMREVDLQLHLDMAAQHLKSAQDFAREKIDIIRAGKAENEKLIDGNRILRNRILELEVERTEALHRTKELSHQIIKLDARAVGNKLRRVVAVIRRELSR